MSEYRWLTPLSQQFLEKDYLVKGQTVDDRVWVIARTGEKLLGIPGWADKFVANFKKGWYSLSTPIWTNFGNDRGLPISCYGTHIADETYDILRANTEIGMMSKVGGGTSAYFGNIRGRGEPIQGGKNGHTGGSVHFLQMFNSTINIISQGSARRGSFAAYLPIDHKDIEEFLTIRGESSPIQDVSFGICIPEGWLDEMVDGDQEKRKIWAKVLDCRARTGYPYLLFSDNVNKYTVDVYIDKLMKIFQSNLCTEILLPNNNFESFVCDLASLNILYYDEWKNDPEAIAILVQLLEAVMTEFIEKAKNIPGLERAVRFARNHRALGIGQLGWHSYLQSKMIAWESMEAKYLNVEIAKHIKEKTWAASADLAKRFGEPSVLKGKRYGFLWLKKTKSYGRRHTTLTAIAPTKSSSFILGQVSEGIEPFKSNYYTKDLAKGKFTVKNPYLEALLKDKGKDTEEVWTSILKRGGSVQHLSFLTEHEKAVFKTFQEISPKEIIIQAAQRQKYIDQGQSTNLMIHPAMPIKDVNALILEAHKLGVKTLYYQYSINAAQAFAQEINACMNCEA